MTDHAARVREARSRLRGQWAEAVNGAPDFDGFESATDALLLAAEAKGRAEAEEAYSERITGAVGHGVPLADIGTDHDGLYDERCVRALLDRCRAEARAEAVRIVEGVRTYHPMEPHTEGSFEDGFQSACDHINDAVAALQRQGEK